MLESVQFSFLASVASITRQFVDGSRLDDKSIASEARGTAFALHSKDLGCRQSLHMHETAYGADNHSK